MDIYAMSLSVIVEEQEGCFKKRKIKRKYNNSNLYPILANSESEAIEKFKLTSVYIHGTTTNHLGWEWFSNPDGERIIEIKGVNCLTIQYLKNNMPSDDFMLYVKDRLKDTNQIMEDILDIEEEE
jgi:hypothetical protein